MNIRFTSTLTHEDENRMAPALLKAVTAFLEMLPVAYSIRIDTIDGKTFWHHGPEQALRAEDAITMTARPGIES